MTTTDIDHPDADAKPKRGRVIFDPTINLGHVLTFVGFMATGFTAYQTLEKRQTVQETRSAMTEERAREEGVRIKEAMSELRTEVKELRRGLEEMNRNLSRMGPRGQGNER
jgi:hypothetical protein